MRKRLQNATSSAGEMQPEKRIRRSKTICSCNSPRPPFLSAHSIFSWFSLYISENSIAKWFKFQSLSLYTWICFLFSSFVAYYASAFVSHELELDSVFSFRSGFWTVLRINACLLVLRLRLVSFFFIHEMRLVK